MLAWTIDKPIEFPKNTNGLNQQRAEVEVQTLLKPHIPTSHPGQDTRSGSGRWSDTAVDPWWVDGTHIVQRLAPATKVDTM